MSKLKIERREKSLRVDCKKDKRILQTCDENTSDLVEKLKEVSLNAERVDFSPNDFEIGRIDKKLVSSVNVQNLNSKETRKKRTGSSKKSTARNRKKDSFIVSDSSVTDDDGVALYHRILAERIKTEVAKVTPRRSIKKKINYDDDGIFTPYIYRRRSDESDSDFSDKENFNNVMPIDDKYSKNNLFKQKPSSDIEKESKSKQSDSDSDSFKSIKSDSSAIISKSKNHKDLSWCFSDRETSSENENDKIVKRFSPVAPRRKSSISTPITFRLNNLKKLTPTPQRLKTPDEHQGSWFFLRSLSTCIGNQRVDSQAEQYKKKFRKTKEQLAEKLFRLFNEDIFDNKLPSDTKIEWSGRMRSTSGFCYNRRIKSIIGPNNECPRTSRIVLSTKIIETPERLRDTLIHEMCHAAAWIIDNKADGHGPCWKSWVSKVHRKFPDLPPIRRCHDYSIKTKFKYRCVNCGYTIGRHSKSLNLERKRCGYCYGKFELLLHNELKSDAVGNSPKNVKARPLSKFALFVKENYGKIKSENAALKHGEIMKVLSKNFAETKNSA